MKICVQDKKSGTGRKPGFFPKGPTFQLQEKAGFLSSIIFFVLYTDENMKEFLYKACKSC